MVTYTYGNGTKVVASLLTSGLKALPGGATLLDAAVNSELETIREEVCHVRVCVRARACLRTGMIVC